MSLTKYYDNKSGKWKITNSTQASTIPILDVEDNFENKNVESALRELSNKSNSTTYKISGIESSFSDLSSNLQDHIQNHPGGSGGGGATTSCVITSTFESGVVENDYDLYIPLFLTPSLGAVSGTAYIMINNIEVGNQLVERGNNRIHIGVLQSIENSISIYVRDNKGYMSEMLSWQVIRGGIDFKLQFDYNTDYSIDDVIRCPYNISSAVDTELTLEITIDSEITKLPIAKQGYGEYIFKKLPIGVHKIKMIVTSGIYHSKQYSFNLIIVSSYNLYVSSTFQDGEYESGIPIIYDYRISKLSNESFNVRLLLDGTLQKTLLAPAGSYTWTISSLPVGEHIICIEVSSNNGEVVNVTNTLNVYQGEYEPIQEVRGGLIANFSSVTMTNEDMNKELWVDLSGNNVAARLHNFNFKTNGWIEVDKGNDKKERVLRCDNEAYVEIDIKPYENNIKLGSTIDILYKSKNIGLEDARIIDYTDTVTPYKGFYADVNKTMLRSATNTGIVNLDEDTEIRLTYVIDRINKFGLIYVNGVINRAFYLSDSGSGVSAFYEDFSHSNKIYLNSEKGIKNFGAVDIKRLRIYDRALSDDEVLQNHLADIEDFNEQIDRYKFNFNNKTTPVIKIFCDKTSFNNMSDTTSVPCRVKYESPNEDFFGQSFDLPYCDVNWQGTSSLQYVLKNYTVRLKDENLEEYLYTPYKNGIKESVFCLKADYMESSHSHNVGMAKFINGCVYDTKTPAQMINNKYRTTIDGFPILVYVNHNDGNGDILLGAYNFNLDRYSTESFGFKNFPKLLAYEVSANSDTTAGAFFKWTGGSGKTETDYYKSDFEIIYPYNRVGNDNFAELIRLVNWVDGASDEIFKEQINEYFNLEYLLRYYLVVMVIGAVDSLGKNMKLITYDGLIWYPQFYDLDTILGLDNTGFLKFGTDIEVVEGVFNTSSSKLWEKVSRIFSVELQKEYALMRLDRFTVDNMMKYIYNEQVLAIPEKIYNVDMKTKYLNFGSSYLYACHGNRSQQIKKWLRERLVYTDTLMKYTNSTSDFITLRSSKLGPVYLDIQTYLPMYLTVKWRDEPDIITNGQITNAGKQTKRVGANETVRFEFTMPTATDQEIVIYAGRYLKSLGDVSNLKPTSMLLGNANKLTSVECHSPNLINVDLAQLLNVQHINLSDCTSLGTGIGAMPTVDLSKCSYIKTLNFNNTKLTAIYTNLNGGSIEKIIYPKSIQAINVRNQERLKVLGVPYDELAGTESVNLANVDVYNCPNLERFSIDESSEDVFKPLKYVQNLTLMNSLALSSIRFDSFKRLKTLSLTNMYKLYNCEFNDLNNVGDVSTLQNIVIQNCPLIDSLNFNVSSDEKSIMFMPEAVLDLSQAYNLRTIKSNTAIKGLKTIILPEGIKDLIFKKEYGVDYSDIKNIWSYSISKSNSDNNYQGIDFKNLNIRDIDLSSTILIPNARNLNISPSSILNIQGDRDGVTNPLLPIDGIIDLTNYTGSCVGLFKGMDLSNISIIKNNDFVQTDFSSMFEGSILGENINIQSLISKIKAATSCSRMFAGSTISKPYMCSTVSDGANLSEMYMDSLITVDVEIPLNAGNVTNLFKNCNSLTHVKSNWNKEYSLGFVSTDCYKGCNSITHIDDENLYVNEVFVGLDPIPINWGGNGFLNEITGMYEVVIPSDNYSISLGDLIGDEYINWGDSLSTNNINSHIYSTAGRYVIKGHVLLNKGITGDEINNSVKECLVKVHRIPKSNPKKRVLFNGCAKLLSADIRNLDTINSIDITNMFTLCSNISSILFPVETIKVKENSKLKELFKNCSMLTSIDLNSFDFTNLVLDDTSFMFSNCSNLETINARNINTTKVVNTTNMFSSVLSTSRITVRKELFTKTESECNFSGTFIWNDLIEFARYTFDNSIEDCMPYSCTINNGYSFVDQISENSTTRVLYANKEIDKPTVLSFKSKTSITSIIYIDTSNLTDMSYMFDGCNLLKSLDLSNVDTTNVTNVRNMFSSVKNTTEIIVKKELFHKTEIECNFSGTFSWIYQGEFARYTFDNSLGDCIPSYCTVSGGYLFNDIRTVGNIVTRSLYSIDSISKPTILSFENKGSLKTIINADTSEIIDMSKMFSGCTNLTSINTSIFTTDNVTSMESMFNGCSNLSLLNLSSFNTVSVTDMSAMFNGCSNLVSLNLSSFDTTKVTNMNSMFHSCMNLVSLDLSHFNTNNVTNVDSMFRECSNLTSLNLSNFNTINIENMNYTFYNCTGLKSLNLLSFNIKTTTSVVSMFELVLSETKISATSGLFNKNENECNFAGYFDWIVTGEFVRYTFDSSLEDCIPDKCAISGGYSYKDLRTVDNIVTRSLYSNDVGIKPKTLSFENKISLKTIINIDTSEITNMASMFYSCSNLTSLNMSNFITKDVVSMNNMFYNCSSLTSLNLSTFNTSKVTDMAYMFYGCSNLISMDLLNFDTLNVTTFDYMFCNCLNLTFLNLSNFNVKATDSVVNMFYLVQSTAEIVAKKELFIKTEIACVFSGTFNWIYPGEFVRYTFDRSLGDCTPFSCVINGGYLIKDVRTVGNIVTRCLHPNNKNNKPTTLSFKNKVSLINVINVDTSAITDMSEMFSGCTGLTSIDTSGFDTSNVTVATNVFTNCTGLTSLNLSSFNTSKITNMVSMFYGCSNLTSLNLSNFDTSNVINMSYMFYNCSALTSLNLSSFNTSNVTGMQYMFQKCTALTTLNLSNFNTSNVLFMQYMFHNCQALTSLNVSNFNTTNVTNMSNMFSSCSGLTTLNLSNFNTSNVTNMPNMFNECTALTTLDILNFNTSSVTNMSNMFNKCSGLTTLNLSNFNTSNVINMPNMFNECTALTTLNLSNFDTSNVINMSNMFTNCYNLISLDLSNFNTYKVANIAYMFDGCAKLSLLDISGFIVQLSDTVTNMFNLVPSTARISITTELFLQTESQSSFLGTFIKTRIITFAEYVFDISLGDCLPTSCVIDGGYSYFDRSASGNNITRWLYANDKISKPKAMTFTNNLSLKTITYIDASNMTTFYNMFGGCRNLTTLYSSGFSTERVTNISYMFQNCSALTSLNISNFDTSNVTNMSYMFHNCTTLTSLNLSNFNTTNVTKMEYMFYNCSALTTLNLSNFNTSNVNSMVSMFYNCSALTTLNLSNFNTSNVNSMVSMFHNCSALTTLNLSNFNTSNVNSMVSMFSNCTTLTSLNLSNFNTTNVTKMEYMFSNCTTLTSLNLSNFDTSNVINMSYMFYNCSALTSLSISFTTSNVTNMNAMFCGCSKLTTLNLSSFNTRNVTSMSSMFHNCQALTSLNVSNFNTTNVTNMSNMFYYCTTLTSLNLSNFDTSNVINMNYMFSGCTRLYSLYFSNFNTRSVITFSSMFSNCTSLSILDLSSFYVNYSADTTGMFSGTSASCRITVTTGLFNKTESQCNFSGTFIKKEIQTYAEMLPYTTEPQVLNLGTSVLTGDQILEITEKGYTIV